MSTPARKRLMLEFKRLKRDPTPFFTGSPMPDDILTWRAVIFGPPGTPFEDGCFQLQLKFTEEYPIKPPVILFLTKMFHPNIFEDGRVCLDTLRDKWSAAYDIQIMLTSILSLLSDPNTESPANLEAATLYRVNKREYEARIKRCIDESLNDEFEAMDEENLDGQIEAGEESFNGQIQASDESFIGQTEASEESFNGQIEASEESFIGQIEASEESFIGQIGASEESFIGQVEASEESFNETDQ